MSRPLDTWRACGHPVTDTDGHGCTCNPQDPTPLLAAKAVERLANDDRGLS